MTSRRALIRGARRTIDRLIINNSCTDKCTVVGLNHGKRTVPELSPHIRDRRRQNDKIVFYDFPFLDNHGRVIGCRIITYGTGFDWDGIATRDGVKFGPVQYDHHAATAQERDSQIDKYLKAARTRAEKKQALTS